MSGKQPDPLGLSLSKALCQACVLALFAIAGPAAAEPPLSLPLLDQIVVRKGERVMELYAGGRLVHTIAGIQLGDVPVGPKRFQGDERTP